MTSALIVGVGGGALSADERAFIADVRPAGVILFQRNVVDASAIRPLIDAIRDAHGGDMLIVIDQEGGRVQRIKAPAARNLPPAAAFADLHRSDPDAALAAAYHIARLCAHELRGYGVTMNCAPVLDVPVDGAHDIIGDRAYGRAPAEIVALARRVADGLSDGGVAPVIKHIPGHGRATADSHLDLPVVTTPHAELSATDFAPFRELADMPAAMTAHVVFASIDAERPASTSARVTADVIRGEIGFDGLLMSDDLSMKALTGPMRARAEAVFSAGSDIALHCNGDIAEMRAVADAAPRLEGKALERFVRTIAVTRRAEPFDVAEATRQLDRLASQTPSTATIAV